MRVEAATAADDDAICALDGLRGGGPDRGEQLRAAIARGECLVARDTAQGIIGFALTNESFFAQRFIALVVVHPDQRRRGVASALIRAPSKRARRRPSSSPRPISRTSRCRRCARRSGSFAAASSKPRRRRSGAHLLQARPLSAATS